MTFQVNVTLGTGAALLVAYVLVRALLWALRVAFEELVALEVQHRFDELLVAVLSLAAIFIPKNERGEFRSDSIALLLGATEEAPSKKLRHVAGMVWYGFKQISARRATSAAYEYLSRRSRGLAIALAEKRWAQRLHHLVVEPFMGLLDEISALLHGLVVGFDQLAGTQRRFVRSVFFVIAAVALINPFVERFTAGRASELFVNFASTITLVVGGLLAKFVLDARESSKVRMAHAVDQVATVPLTGVAWVKHHVGGLARRLKTRDRN